MKKNDGFLIINKSGGCTSHDCVKQIRKIYNTKKVGHTGTLDPQVTGILPMALGNATRFIQYLPREKKYIGTIKLGIKTSTDDIYGEVFTTKDWPIISYEDLNNRLNFFRGKIKQIPPKVSSVHVQGERAYEKSFRKENFELEAREVTINELILERWDQLSGEIDFKISCSSGTYIRSIARDLGKELQSEGCLLNLKRIASSGFDEKNSIDIDTLKKITNIKKYIIPTIDALNHLPKIILKDEKEIIYWETGRKINLDIGSKTLIEDLKTKDPIKVIDKNNKLLGIGFISNSEINYLEPKLVLNAR